ncbi:uncharacterized protein LODBEIA_P15870 [Lodderomyces beijingensis]|uniref:Uncharacterized protein n=1 Tax=Lodderomyces beijingensis TaxID=1775926 RepID=A0ABP0ZGS1_9ASCO
MALSRNKTPLLPHVASERSWSASRAHQHNQHSKQGCRRRKETACVDNEEMAIKDELRNIEEEFDYERSCEDDCDSYDKTPSPNKIVNLNDEEYMGFASTPLNSNQTLSFLSPIKRLNDLHLESRVIDDVVSDEQGNERDCEDDDQNEQDDQDIQNEQDDPKSHNDHIDEDIYDQYAAGNKTIANNSDDSGDELDISPPKYINMKKRHHSNFEPVRLVTPVMTADATIGKESKMSTCRTISGSTPGSTVKYSFSPNDSTPCPIQPKRKKLRFNHTSTKNILDLNCARKTSVQDLFSRQVSAGSQLDDEFDEKNHSTSFDKRNDMESTPISQSTPSSSRASTPPLPLPVPSQEYGPAINGYKFVQKVQPKSSQFKYETPLNLNRYNHLRDSYNSRNYQILGELPITSAGLMKESEENVHVGDKRIKTPAYDPLHLPRASSTLDLNIEAIRNEYHGSAICLPLLPPLFDQKDILSESQLLQELTPVKVTRFYELIQAGSMMDFLKSERFKWHPDRWVGKYKVGGDTKSPIPLKIVEQLSQIINGLIEQYEDA